MSTTAKPGIGAILNRWDDSGSTGVWEEIVEVTNLSWDGASREAIDVFKLNSTDGYMNKVKGVKNANTITATICFNQAEFVKLLAELEDDSNANVEYQIVLPDGEGIEWAGFVLELPLDIGSEDVMQGDVVFAVDGKADFVTTASASPV
jgi:hypothetical protein